MKADPRSVRTVRTALWGASGAVLWLAASSAAAQQTPVGLITDTTPAPGGQPPIIDTPDGDAPAAGAQVTNITVRNSRTILDWATFVLESNDTLNFEFNARNDIVLNRVAAGSAQVNGALNGTVGGVTGGNVWFQATDGVLFGNGSVVNVGGLLATTGTITNNDFRGGNLDFSFNSAAAGQVRVAGGATINLAGGTLALVAPEVVTEAGSTIAGDADSDVLFGAAQNMRLTFAQEADNDLSLLDFVVPGNALANGSVSAAPIAVAGNTTAGTVFVAAVSRNAATAVISLGGLTTATGAAADGGDIILSGGAEITGRALGAAKGNSVDTTVADLTAADDIRLETSGGLQLDASAIESTGGDVELLAPVELANGAVSVAAADELRFAGTVDGAQGLSVSGAAIAFEGSVGGTAALASLQASGPVTLSAPLIRTTGNVTLDDLVLADGGAAREVDAGGALVVTGAVTDSVADAHDLTLRGASVAVGNVGVGGRVRSATFDGPTTLSGDVTAQNAVEFQDTLTLTDPAGANAVRTVTGGSASFQGVLAAAGDEGRLLVDVGGNASFNGDLGAAGDALGRLGVRADAASFAGTNRVERLAADIATGGFGFTNAEALTIGQVGGLSGVTVTAGGAALATTASDLQLDEAVTATGQNLALTSAGRIDQASGGIVTAGVLSLASVSGADLTADNQVTELAAAANSGAGDIALNNARSLTVSGVVDNTVGAVTFTVDGALTTGSVSAAGNLTLRGDSVSTGALTSGEDVVVRATVAFADVASASAQDDIFVTAANGDATLRAATLATDTSLLDQLSVGAGFTDAPLVRQVVVRSQGGGVAQLGADSVAAIGAGNVLDTSGVAFPESALVEVRSASGEARAHLFSLDRQIDTLSGGSVSAAAQTGDLSLGVVDADDDAALSAEAGLLSAATVTVGRDYSVLAQDFAGDVLTPGGSIRDFSLTDTLGGLTFTDVTAQRNLTLAALNGGALSGGSATGQTGSVTLIGSGLTLTGNVEAATSATITGGAGGVSLVDVTADAGSVDISGAGVVAQELTAGLDVRVASSVGASVQSATAGDDIFVTAATGSATLRRAVLAADAGAAGVDIDGAGGLDQGGDLRQLVLSASAPGAAAILGADGEAGVAADNDVTAAAGETVQASVSSAGDVLVFLDTLNLQGGPLTVSAGADGALAVQSGTLDLGTVTVGDDLLARALGGDLSFTDVTAPGDVVLSASGALSGTSVTAVAGLVDLRGSNVAVTGVASAGAGGVTVVATNGDAAVGSASATDDILVTAAGGSASLGAASLTAGVDGDGDGFNLEIVATGAGADAVLGSAGAVGAGNTLNVSAGVAIRVDASAGRDALVGLTGDFTADAVSGARNAVVRTVDSGNGVGGDDVTVTTLVAGSGDATVEAADGVAAIANLSAGADVSVTGRAISNTAGIVAGDDLSLNATAAGLTFTDLTAPGSLTLTAAGAVIGDNATATAGSVRLQGASVVLSGAASAGEDVFALGAAGGASLGSAAAGDDIFVVGQGGSASLGAATLTADGDPADPVSDFGLGLDVGGTTRQIVVAASGVGADAVLGSAAPTGANVLSVTGGADDLAVRVSSADRDAVVGLQSATRDGAPFSFDLVQGGRDASVRLLSGDLSITTLSARDDASAATDAGDLTIERATAETTVAVDGEADGSNLRLTAAGGELQVQTARADADVRLLADGDISIGLLAQAGDDLLAASGAGDVLAAGADLVASEGALAAGALGRVDADGLGSNVGVSANDLTVDDIIAGASVILSLTGDLTFDSIDICVDGLAGCSGDLDIAVGGDLTGTALAAADDLTVQAGGSLSLTTATAGGDLSLSALTGDLTLSGAATAGDDASIVAAGLVTLPSVSALRGGASTDDEAAGAAGAGSNVLIEGGALALGTVRAGSDVTLRALNDGVAVDEIVGGDDVRVEALNGDGDDLGLGQDDVVMTTLRADSGAAAAAPGDFADVGADGNNAVVIAAGDVQVTTGAARGDLSVSGRNVTLSTGRAGRDLALSATGAATGGSWRALDDLSVVAGTGDVTLADGFAGDELRIEGRNVTATALVARRGDGVVSDELAAGPGFPAGDEAGDNSNVTVLADADITVDEAEANGDVVFTAGSRTGGALAAGAQITVIGSVLAGDDVTLRSGGALSVGVVEALRVDHGTAAFVDTGQVGSNVELSAASITAGGVSADDGAALVADSGDVDVNLLAAGDAASVIAARDVVLDVGDATGSLTLDAGRDAVLATAASDVDLSVRAGRNVTALDLAAGRDLDVDASAALNVATLSASRDVALAAATADLGSATAGRNLGLTATGAAVLGTAEATGGELALTAASLNVGSATAGGSAALTAADEITADALTAGVDLTVDAGGSATLQTATAGQDVRLLTSGLDGDVAVDTATAGRSLLVDASGAATLGDLRTTAGDLIVLADADVALTQADSGRDLTIEAGQDLIATTLAAAQDMSLRSGDGLTVTTARAGGDFSGEAGGTAALGDVEAGDALTLTAQALDLGVAASGGAASLTTTLDLVVDSLDAGGAATLVAGRDATLGDIAAAANLNLTIGRNATADSLDAGDDLRADVGGSATLGTAMAGRDAVLEVGLAGGLADGAGDLQVTTLSAVRDVRLTTDGAIRLGSAAAGRDLSATAGTAGSADGGDGVAATTLMAGQDLLVQASNGAIAVDSATAARNATLVNGTDGGGALSLGEVTAATGSIALSALLIDVGTAVAGQSITASALGDEAGDIVVGDAQAGLDVSLTANGGVNATTLQAGRDIGVSGAFGDVTIGAATAGRDLTLASADASGDAVLTAGTLRAGDDVRILWEPNRTATVGSATAGGGTDTEADGANVVMRARGSVEVASAAAAGDVLVQSLGGDARLDAATAGDDLFLAAAGTARLGDATLTGAGPDLDSDGAGPPDAAGNGRQLLVSGTEVIVDGALVTPGGAGVTFEAAGDVTLTLAGDLEVTTLRAGDDVRVSTPTGTLTVQTAEATGAGVDGEGDGSNVDLSGRSVRVTTLARAAGDVAIQSTAGDAFVQRAEAGDDVFVRAQDGTAQLRGVVLTDAGPDLDSDGAGDIDTAGDGRRLRVEARGADADAVLGAVGAPGAADQLVVPATARVFVAADRDAVANLTGDAAFAADAGRDVRIAVTGDLTLTGVVAGDDVDASAGGVLRSTAILQAAGTGTGDGGGFNVRLTGQSVEGVSVFAASDVIVDASAGSIRFDSVTAGDDAFLTAQGGDVTVGAMSLTALTDFDGDGAGTQDAGSAAHRAILRGSQDVIVGVAIEPEDKQLTVVSPDDTAVSLIAGRDVRVSLVGGTTLTRAEAGQDVILSLGALTVRALGEDPSGVIAGRDAQLDADSQTVETVVAGRDATLTGGSVTVTQSLKAGDDVVVSAALADLTGVRTTGLAADTESGDAAEAGVGSDIVIVSENDDGTAGSSIRLAGDSQAANDFFVITGRTGTATFDGTLAAADDGLLRVGDVNIGADGRIEVGDRLDIESRRGGVLLGDGATLADALTLDEAEFGRITAPTLEVYAGSTADTAVRGNLVVGDLTYDPALVQNLTLLAGPANEVQVRGAVAPSTQGVGAVRIGRPESSSGWTPRDVIITGSIGTAVANGELVDRTTAKTFDSVEINAGQDILIGADDRFVDSIREADPEAINLTRNRPAGASLAPADLGRVFIASDTLTLRADGKVVQQNTGGAPGRAQGIYLDNGDALQQILTIGTTGGGASAPGEPAPAIVELFLSFRDRGGQLISRQIAAANPGVVLDEGVVRSNRLRINGCVIGAAGNCTPLADTILIIEPERLLEGLVLAAQDDEEEDDPTITGAGNEEIWRTPE